MVVRRILSVILILLSGFLLCSCWNYAEINEVAIVAGVAFDKSIETGKYKVTVEIIDPPPSERSGEFQTLLREGEGSTIFEAIRALVPKIGKRAYWSHAKVVIINKYIAYEDLLAVLDWIARDNEVRYDLNILISREETASAILQQNPTLNRAISFQISDTINRYEDASVFPNTSLTIDLVRNLMRDGIDPILPTVSIENVNDRASPRVHDSAVLKNGKLEGFLNEKDTKLLLFVRDEVKGGLYIINGYKDEKTKVSLEIYNNKTRVTPIVKKDKLSILVEVKPVVEIAEISNQTDLTKEKELKSFEKYVEAHMERELTALIKKVKTEYGADILKFSNAVKLKKPAYWKKVKGNWRDIFSSVETEVNVDLTIRGTATSTKPIIPGE